MTGIRADANEQIAMGHVMRCCAIAEQLRKAGETVLFIISEDYVENYLRDRGFRCICLHNSYRDKEDETEKLLDIINQEKIDRLLLDSYQVTEKYMKALRAHTRLIYIDDMNMFRYEADVIINYMFKAEYSLYEKWGYDEETTFFLGSHYVPLREEFSGEAIEVKENVKRIFMTTGGIDKYDMLLGVLEAMDGERFLKNVEKCVIAGKFYENMEALKKFAQERPQISVHQNVSDMYGLMKNCDMAISAGGTTLAELGACGVPTVCFSVAQNQEASTKAYGEENIMVFAGNVCVDRERVIKNIVEETASLAGDYIARREMASVMRRHFDGRGAERIAEIILGD